MDHHEHHVPGAAWLSPGESATALLLVTTLVAYAVAVAILHRRGTSWPVARTVSWAAGLLCVGVALVGPLTERAHHDFTVHMAGHVLLGMLGPLLLVLAAPITLALRVLPVRTTRPLARLLSSLPLAVLTNPFVAGVLNIGGLWVLYRTGLYTVMHTDPLVHALIHAHVLAAGYLFTFAVLGGPDPAPHRPSPPWRAAALVLAIAAHNILAKTLYAAPPEGVPAEQARAGAELMYYAGAPVEIALIFLVCRPWILPRRKASNAVGFEAV
ncbi:putative membrane protein [Spinactinospora alkalitolerans]|uniref:Putative membrane protein n=1 Tax=Spinactinospora alkalitolerans TaxID=687207 RepID=A0A852TSZ3_9ACTN|nr:cytochrome c oxidase assembly protein [Spinactinospora alkalitolerans]NYE47556.1 putative membrane protein [Spinactinospora alkalitolerans]